MRVFDVRFCGVILGGTAVVVAEDKAEARTIIRRELKSHGLAEKNKGRGAIEINEVPSPYPSCVIQSNGDY